MSCIPEGEIDWGDADDAEVSPEVAAQRLVAESLAWSTLQVLTAYQLALCATVVRPSRQGCAQRSYYVSPEVSGAPYMPYIGDGGKWYNHVQGCGCDHETVEEVLLPGPVGRVVGVEVDGVVINPQSYRVDDGVRLVRTDGLGWPKRQDMSADRGEVGNFIVAYYRGAVADAMDKFAASQLAKEFIKAFRNDKNCRLPKNVTAVVRQGVSYEMNRSMFDGDSIGIAEVDAIIARRNPYKLKTPPVIMSLDRRDPRLNTVSPAEWVPTPPPNAPKPGRLVPDRNNPGYFVLEGE